MEVLERKLKSLRLSGIGQVLTIRNHEAVQAKLGYLEFLELLVDDELTRRKSKLYERRSRQAGFPVEKRLEDFDFSFNEKINARQIHDLCAGRFLQSAENVLFLGPPGVGKSHLAVAIGLKVIRAGYSVRYYAADDLASACADAMAADRTDGFLADLSRVNLLILDDLGLKKLPPSAGEFLLDVVRSRYERSSILITSNRPFDDWGKILGDTAAATAILDRILHHAHVVQITGKSYRIAKRNTPSTLEESLLQEPKRPGRNRPR